MYTNFLLAGTRCDASSNQRSLEGFYVLVSYEQAQSRIDLGFPGVIGNYTVGQGANNSVAGPVVHGGLEIYTEQSGIAVCAGTNGALDRIESFLTSLGTGDLQPCFSAIGMRSANGQREGVGQELEYANATGNGSPAVVNHRFISEFAEVSFGPVAHYIESGIAINDELCGILPGQGSGIRVRVGQNLW